MLVLFVIRLKLTDKKRQCERRTLASLDCNSNEALQSLLVEVDGTRLGLEFGEQQIRPFPSVTNCGITSSCSGFSAG